MKDIIVLDTPIGDEVDFSVRERYYGRFFAQSWNKDEQWALLERMRREGGMIMADVESRKDTVLKELMEPFLDEEGAAQESWAYTCQDQGTRRIWRIPLY